MVLLIVRFLRQLKFFLRKLLLDSDKTLWKLIGRLLKLASAWRGQKLELHQL